ncbi:MAG: FtsX-like permease family protein, partial [Bryobacteraceae bacterium]|nr:FtsX-like permease family protein [Bryobacteraceae bacterium]
AMGAGRGRLVRQLLIEALLISSVAGTIGFAASYWVMSLGSKVYMPFPMPVAFDLRPDSTVLFLSVAATLMTGLVTGLAPALQITGTQLAPALKEAGEVFFAGRKVGLRKVLIVSQVAAALGLLVILGILSVGIRTTLGFDSGFDPRHLYIASFDPVRDGYTSQRAADFFRNLVADVQQLPSVQSAAWTESVPVSMPGAMVRAWDVGVPNVKPVRAIPHVVGDRYFETARISIQEGRSFGIADFADDANTVIVSAAFVRELGSTGASVGRVIEVENGELGPARILPGSFDHRLTVSRATRFQIVGVAADINEGLVVGKPRPAVYLPLRASAFANPPVQGIALLIRAVPGSDVLADLRKRVARIDAAMNVIDPHSMKERIARFTAPLRMAVWTYGAVGVFGLILAAVGVTGLTAYSVVRRTREIAIRLALGASRWQVVSLVTREGLVLTSIGTALGMALAAAGASLLTAMDSTVARVTSTSTTDPVVLIGAPLVLGCVTLLACYIPARRCLRLNPALTLKHD